MNEVPQLLTCLLENNGMKRTDRIDTAHRSNRLYTNRQVLKFICVQLSPHRGLQKQLLHPWYKIIPLEKSRISFATLLSRPPLWSTGQSSWLQIQSSGFDSRRYQIFWEVVDLERGPLSLVSTTVELLERKSRDSGLENRDYGSRDPSSWPHATIY
jgi:hypothetical protein